jgi:hypothetical protein
VIAGLGIGFVTILILWIRDHCSDKNVGRAVENLADENAARARTQAAAAIKEAERLAAEKVAAADKEKKDAGISNLSGYLRRKHDKRG